MEAAKPVLPTPKEKIFSIKEPKEFSFINDQKEFIVSVGKSSISEKLGIQLKESSFEQNFFYENFFSLDELKNISKYFRIFDNIDEVIPDIEAIFEEKQYSIKFENDKLMIILKFNKIGKGEELISLELNKNSLSLEKICENLIKEIKNLKNKIIEQEKEINNLKEKKENNELINEIQLIKEENKKKDLILEELLNWKKNIEKKIETKNGSEKLELNIDSNIIETKSELDLIINELIFKEPFNNKYSSDISFKLIYRGTRDGHLSSDFHKKCDGFDKTVTLIKTKKGLKFGGYITNGWGSSEDYVDDDEDCFAFSISLRKIYYPKEGKFKYFFGKDYGPDFALFGLENNLFEKSSLNIHTKEDANVFFTSFTSDYEINGGEKEFQVEELEVFQVLTQ